MKAFVFDLGDTLIEYEGVPLNWESRYPDALRNFARFLKLAPDSAQIAAGCAILRKYNTRLHPRESEVTFATILEELCASWQVSKTETDEIRDATVFFEVFRQKLRCFPETKIALQTLRQRGVAIGIFTDVPYGMPPNLVLADIRGAGLEGLFDVLLTSREIGYRKPRVETIAAVATRLKCSAHEIVHVGNEKKDIEVATAFGCRAVLINRGGQKIDWGQHRTISSLMELTDEK